jgi:hypothetical protein
MSAHTFTQIGHPGSDGVLVWGELEPLPGLDSLQNLRRRWRTARTYRSKDVVDIPDGIEMNLSIDAPGSRQRLLWI